MPRASRRARRRLWRWSPWWEQRTQEEVIFRIPDAIPILIDPPSSAEITRLAGAELGLAVRQELEWPLHRQRILDHKRVVVQALARHVDDARRAVAEPRRRHSGL